MDKSEQTARVAQLAQSELDLRRRLTEAEDTLEAIRGGEVDAVVVDDHTGPQIYTLESPDQPFRVFVEQMQEGALTLNADGTIIYCNRFFADLVERPLKQVRGQAIQDFVREEDRPQFQTLFEIASRAVVRGECRLRASSGADFPVQLAFNPLPPEDLHMCGVVITDLTERERAKQLEAERLAAEEANAARDQFLAVVSHELRTPLNAILGWSQLLRRQNGLSPAAERGLEIIERSAWSQSQLIDDLLDVSRVLAGKLRLDLRAVDLNRIIESTVGSIQPTAEAKRITLDLDLSEPSLKVKGDADRLQQVIANLLSNAVKFTPEKGKVDVSLCRSGTSAELKISDTGVGIPAEFLPRLFDLYQQIEGSTTRRAGGLGLGLAIVKELTELHGGKVWAESPGTGKGATFTLRLPLVESSAAGERQTGTPPLVHGSALESLHLLVIEDEDITRDMLTQALEGLRAKVTAVATAPEALEALQRDTIDLLLSDIALPGMDGYELIRRIREAGHSGRELPAIALTAFAGREDRRRALLAGYQVHLSKPVDQNELFAAIASLAGN